MKSESFTVICAANIPASSRGGGLAGILTVADRNQSRAAIMATNAAIQLKAIFQ
jgi:hypothetical protein